MEIEKSSGERGRLPGIKRRRRAVASPEFAIITQAFEAPQDTGQRLAIQWPLRRYRWLRAACRQVRRKPATLS